MRNIKHTIVGVVAVAMIGTMSIHQINNIIVSNRLEALLSNSSSGDIVLKQEDILLSNDEIEENLYETYTEDEIEEISVKKSELQSSYVLLTYGSLSVYAEPSSESEIIDELPQKTEVKVMESSEGFLKVSYDSGKMGYVLADKVTSSKSEADYAAMHYDNYKKAVVKTNGGSVRVRSTASTSGDIVSELENGTPIALLWDENGFTKVFYGDDLNQGFVVSSCIELTGEWLSKTDVASVHQAVADRKAAAEKAAAEKAAAEKVAKLAAEKAAAEKAAAEKAAAAKAAAAKSASKTTTASKNVSSSYEAPATSGKGGSIVSNAKKYLGVKYVYGGTSPKGFDCSGLVQYVCKSAGISVGRTAASQFGNGRAVNKADLQPGDLLFFAKNGKIHHVGIYVGNCQMIHAPQTGDVVRYASINTSYRQNEYVGARRVY